MNIKVKAFLAICMAIALSACQTPNAKRGDSQNSPLQPFTETSTAALTAQFGENWSAKGENVLVRGTAYKCGKGASDSDSRKHRSSGGIRIDYGAELNQLGYIAAPHKFRRGSIVVAQTIYGPRAYWIIDWGTAVENGTAVKKMIAAGKKLTDKQKIARGLMLTEAEKKAPVFDFCEPRELWPNPFLVVTVYRYIGNEDFDDLKMEDRQALLAQVKLRAASMTRLIAHR